VDLGIRNPEFRIWKFECSLAVCWLNLESGIRWKSDTKFGILNSESTVRKLNACLLAGCWLLLGSHSYLASWLALTAGWLAGWLAAWLSQLAAGCWLAFTIGWLAAGC